MPEKVDYDFGMEKKIREDGNTEYTYCSFEPVLNDEYLRFVESDIALEIAYEEELRRQEFKHQAEIDYLSSKINE